MRQCNLHLLVMIDSNSLVVTGRKRDCVYLRESWDIMISVHTFIHINLSIPVPNMAKHRTAFLQGLFLLGLISPLPRHKIQTRFGTTIQFTMGTTTFPQQRAISAASSTFVCVVLTWIALSGGDIIAARHRFPIAGRTEELPLLTANISAATTAAITRSRHFLTGSFAGRSRE